jgi:hypothetical protein
MLAVRPLLSTAMNHIDSGENGGVFQQRVFWPLKVWKTAVAIISVEDSGENFLRTPNHGAGSAWVAEETGGRNFEGASARPSEGQLLGTLMA